MAHLHYAGVVADCFRGGYITNKNETVCISRYHLIKKNSIFKNVLDF